MEGDFYLYLRTQANHDRFPFKYLEQLISRVESWNHDTLPLHNRKLKNAFKPLRVAVETYQTTLLSETYTMGSGPYPAQEYNENFVQVAPEWVSEDPTRYKVAYKNLNDQRIALVEALETIFTVVHELEASGSDSH